MDIENANVFKEPVTKCEATIFSELVFTSSVTSFHLSRIWNRGNVAPDKSVTILNRASGAIRPGRLTFILGPSGAGKSTLLKILARRKKSGVSGYLHGAGRSTVLVSQHVNLIDTLTAMETLIFAAKLKLPNADNHDRNNTIRTITKQLGIQEVLYTRAGNLSGGERRRLSIACELLTDPNVMLLDEPTSGLDSVSSMLVIKSLQTVARGGRTIACVVHQPSSKLYLMADDVILMANGKTLYVGSVMDAPEILARAKFQCPIYYNMADFLLEVASRELDGDYSLLENEAKSFAYEMKAIARTAVHVNGQTNEAEALLSTKANVSDGYKANTRQQICALLWRCFIGALRDVHLTQIRLICHLLVALLLGALYNGAGEDGARVLSNTACLFFFLLFLFFSNAMATINTFPVEAEVVLQEHLNKWYSLPTYCISKILIDLPIQVLCATLFLFPAWYLTSQPLDCHRMSLAWTICVLVTILAQTFGLVFGAGCGVKLGMFLVPATNIPMLMFSEFFIPYKEMPVYLRPFATISYFRYAFEGYLQTVYGFGREILPCHQVFCMFRDPNKYLKHLGLTRDFKYDIYALLIWIGILQVAFICVLAIRVYKTCR